ncbi:TIR domain-containing protein [Alkalibacillus silvisoli]|uniref:TIR domain-containing protein n=1 Tax=Alkalibacillus silvisoli TaxID=392823 RepID=A0ABP3JJU0_9BACI
MAKRVFFSFHYQDVIDFRANVVRNHWFTKPGREDAGFFDASLWEDAKKQGDPSIKRLINDGIQNTSATVVLVGSQTYNRRWVRYEIIKSLQKGNRLIAIHINSIKGRDGCVKVSGPNPFEYLGVRYSDNGNRLELYEYRNGRWISYRDLSSYELIRKAPVEMRGRFHKISDSYSIYDWVRSDGYNRFSEWVS